MTMFARKRLCFFVLALMIAGCTKSDSDSSSGSGGSGGGAKVSKAESEARDAASNGDWTRARAAAKKAEVLSQELASSL